MGQIPGRKQHIQKEDLEEFDKETIYKVCAWLKEINKVGVTALIQTMGEWGDFPTHWSEGRAVTGTLSPVTVLSCSAANMGPATHALHVHHTHHAWAEGDKGMDILSSALLPSLLLLIGGIRPEAREQEILLEKSALVRLPAQRWAERGGDWIFGASEACPEQSSFAWHYFERFIHIVLCSCVLFIFHCYVLLYCVSLSLFILLLLDIWAEPCLWPS